jgi:hypothetical protein
MAIDFSVSNWLTCAPPRGRALRRRLARVGRERSGLRLRARQAPPPAPERVAEAAARARLVARRRDHGHELGLGVRGRSGLRALARRDLAHRGPQVVAHLGDALVALVGLLGERAVEYALDGLGRVVAAHLADGLGRVVQDRVANLHGRLPLEGPYPREHLVEQHARREDVGAVVYLLARSLLGRGVRGRAVGDAQLGQVNVAALHALVQKFGEAEVQDLREPRVRHHHVAGLYVAVDDALRVRGRERVGDLVGDGERAFEREGAAVDELAHVAPLDVLHRDEVDSVVRLVQAVDGADVRVVEGGGELRLALEALEVDLARRQLR